MGSERFPALLSVLLYTTVVQTADAVIKIDTFPEVVDYKNCRDEMFQRVTEPGGLLQKELDKNQELKSMWKPDAKCSKKIPELQQEHMAALKSYADAGDQFQKLFNKQLYNTVKNITTYQDEFPFKSLYFLLTDAIQRLNKNNKSCKVYSSIKREFNLRVGESIRFGKFFPAKLKYSEATEDIEDDGWTVFNITSCSVVNLDEIQCDSEELDLLISPTEAFVVQHRRTVRDQDETYTEVSVMSISLPKSADCRSLVSLSASDLLSSSLLNLMAPVVMVYLSTFAL